jgi:protein TonB
VAAAVEEAIPFDPDPPPADLEPPEDLPPPPETVEDLEPIEAAPDPRFATGDEPPGDPDAHIGIAAPGGTNRPVPGGRRRAVGRTDTPPAPTVDPAAMPAPAPTVVREPVREPARRAPGLCPPPRYPERERSRGIEGSLRLRVEVAADGGVTAVTVEESSGSAALDAAAVEAVRAWRFLPGTVDGVPVASVAFQPVAFRLEASR